MKATISYSPTTLHAAHLSIDDEVFSPDSDFGFSISRDRLQPKRLLNVPLLNLTGLQTPLGNRTIQLSESCLSSRHRSQIHCRDATTANSSAFRTVFVRIFEATYPFRWHSLCSRIRRNRSRNTESRSSSANHIHPIFIG